MAKKKKAPVKKVSTAKVKKTDGRGQNTSIVVTKRRESLEEDLIHGDARPIVLAKKYGVSTYTICKDLQAIQIEWAKQNNGQLDAKRARRIGQLEYSAALAMKGFKESADRYDEDGNKCPGDIGFLNSFKDAVSRIAKLEGLEVDKSEVKVSGRIDVQTLAVTLAHVPDEELDKIVEAAEKFEKLTGKSLLLESKIGE